MTADPAKPSSYDGLVSFGDDIRSAVDRVLQTTWESRDGIVVPTTEDITLKNGAVNIDATYVYADLADSSSLGQKVKDTVAAKIVRAYLDAATRILTKYNGEIRSFDGDRVLAIFIGGSKNSDAVRSALALNWMVDEVIKPKIKSQWSDIDKYWTAGHGVGIDTGPAMLVRGGVRDSNDLISIGSAPNVAAKLSELRCHKIHITRSVHEKTRKSNKLSTDGTRNRWTTHPSVSVANRSHEVLSSGWRWTP